MPAAPAMRGRPQPAGDAADAHEVRHDEVAAPCAAAPCSSSRGTVEVLADLDRRLELGARAAHSRRGCRRRSAPRSRSRPWSSIAWQRCSASPRFRPWLKSTISFMSSPTAVADRGDRREVVGEPSRPRRSLSPVKPPSSRSSIASAATALRCCQPQAVAVVGLHRADASRRAARRAACPAALASASQAAMSRPDDRDHRQAFVADEVQRSACRVEQLDRRHSAALKRGAEIVRAPAPDSACDLTI